MRVPKAFGGGCIDFSDRHTVGILAFEAAAAMARVVSLHRTLADDHFLPLCDNMRSLGVAHFLSKNQSFPFLLRLTCAELIADLDAVAATVRRFSLNCRDPLLRRFDGCYGSVKAAALRRGRVADLDHLGLGSMVKNAAKWIKKMEKYVASTSLLQKELLKLEESEKAQDSKQFPKQRKHGAALEAQRLNVRGLKERSLWSWTFDEVVQPMAGAVFTVFARIYDVFVLQVLSSRPLPPAETMAASSCSPAPSRMLDRPSLVAKDVLLTIEKLPSLKAGPSTVGGSGLSFSYAELIVMAESLFARWELDNAVDEGLMAMRQIETTVRDVLCHKMTPSMRCTVTEKLEEILRRKKNGRTKMSSMETDSWRNELERILGWLGPLARNTGRWKEEHTAEQFLVGPRVLLSQTLHFADLNLTKTAIIDVFVGLSSLLLVPYE